MYPTTVVLHGELGRKYGRTHKVYLDTNLPEELMSYFRTQFKGFAAYMASSRERGVGYQIFAGEQELNHEGLAAPFPGALIRFAPRILGAKSGGVFSIILGAVLIVVGGFIAGWTFGAGAPVGTAIAGMGLSMIAGGVVQLLTPTPKGLSSKDSPANTASYSFNGPVNTEAQGNPVPILIGEMICGSAVISAGITTATNTYVPTTPGNGSMGSAGGGSANQSTSLAA